MICSRLNTAVGRPRNAFRMPNSIAVRRSGVPAKAATCCVGSIESAPCARAGPAAAPPPPLAASGPPPQDHVPPRDQLARAERFGHVIVAADLQPQHAVDLVVARG